MFSSKGNIDCVYSICSFWIALLYENLDLDSLPAANALMAHPEVLAPSLSRSQMAWPLWSQEPKVWEPETLGEETAAVGEARLMG